MRAFHAIGLVAILALAGEARAQEAFDGRYQRGERIGKGKFKSFYAIEGRPDLALGIVERPDGPPGDAPLGDDEETPRQIPLEREKALLDRLAAKGVPVAEILEIGTWGGKPAYVQKRFVSSDRDEEFFDKKRWELLNENSIADLEKTERALKKARIDVADLQFLVAADGHLAVADPMKITRRTTVNDADEVIPTLLHWAREAIEARKKKLLAAAKDEKIVRPADEARPERGSSPGLARILERAVVPDRER